jgi:hypothetical protein
MVADPESKGYLDTGDVRYSIYTMDARYLSLNFQLLNHPGRRVLIVGASNSALGFRPSLMKPLLGGIEVDNISLGGSNITAVEEVIDLAYKNMPREAWPQTTFALGLFYRLFVPDASIFGKRETPLENQGMQWALYQRTSTGIHPGLADRWTPALKYVIRPFLLPSWIRWVYFEPQTWGKNLLLLDLRLKRIDYDTFTLTPTTRNNVLGEERDVTSDYSKGFQLQFAKLDRMARLISSRGGRLVLMELPVPSWIQAGVPAYGFYRAEEDRQIRELIKIPGVTYGSMAEGFSDDEFYDQFHPRPRTTVRWVRKAAAIILEGGAAR